MPPKPYRPTRAAVSVKARPNIHAIGAEMAAQVPMDQSSDTAPVAVSFGGGFFVEVRVDVFGVDV